MSYEYSLYHLDHKYTIINTRMYNRSSVYRRLCAYSEKKGKRNETKNLLLLAQ